MRNYARGFFCVKNRLKLKVYKFEIFLIHFLLPTSYFLLPTSHCVIPYRVHAYLAWNLRRNAMTVVPVTTPYDVGHECDGETQHAMSLSTGHKLIAAPPTIAGSR